MFRFPSCRRPASTAFRIALLFLAAVDARAQGRRWTVAPEPSWVESAPLPEERPDGKGTATGVRYLLSDHQVSVTGGTSSDYQRWAWKVLSTSGLDDASQIEMNFEPAYERLVIHYVRQTRDGRPVGSWSPRDVKVIQHEDQLAERIYDESLTALIFLKDLRPGDIVDYAYTVEGQNPVLHGRFADSLSLAFGVPVSRVRHRLLWPIGRTLHEKSHGTTVRPTVTTNEAHATYVWEQRNVPARATDEDAPPWFDDTPWVQLSEFDSWGAVSTWASDLFAAQARVSSPAIDRLVEPWRALPTEEARARAAVRMVQDEIRYLGIEVGPNSHEPHAPAQVLDQRFGDCKDKALLLSVLLRKLGIEATPALVNTESRRSLDAWLPTPFAFDHVIVQARVEGKPIWIDATASLQGGSITSLANPPFERALMIRAGEAGLTKVPAVEARTPTTLIDETYTAPRGSRLATLRVVTTYSGDDADDVRASIESESPDERARGYLNYYSRIHPGIRAVEPPEVKDSRDTNLLTVTERYEIPTFWKNGGIWLRAWPLSERLARPATTVRSSPLGIDHPVSVRYRLKVEDLKSVPEPIEPALVMDPAFRVSRTMETEPGAITLAYDFTSRADAVPTQALPAYLEHIEEARELLDYELEQAAVGAAFGFRSSPPETWMLGILAAFGSFSTALFLRSRMRERARRTARAALFDHALGAAPETALRATDAADARLKMLGVPCGCGATIEDHGEWTECRYDGRRMSVVVRSCGVCRRPQSLYVDVAPEIAPTA